MKQIQINQREQSIIKNAPATIYMKNSQVIFWFHPLRKKKNIKIAINNKLFSHIHVSLRFGGCYVHSLEEVFLKEWTAEDIPKSIQLSSHSKRQCFCPFFHFSCWTHHWVMAGPLNSQHIALHWQSHSFISASHRAVSTCCCHEIPGLCMTIYTNEEPGNT